MDTVTSRPRSGTADIGEAMDEDLEWMASAFATLRIRPGAARLTVRSLPFHRDSSRARAAMAERLRSEGENVRTGILWPALPAALRAFAGRRRYGAVGMSLAAPLCAVGIPPGELAEELAGLGAPRQRTEIPLGRPGSCVRASSWSSVLIERARS